eukprot:324828-Prorocentrum_minimum.AAC.1
MNKSRTVGPGFPTSGPSTPPEDREAQQYDRLLPTGTRTHTREEESRNQERQETGTRGRREGRPSS